MVGNTTLSDFDIFNQKTVKRMTPVLVRGLPGPNLDYKPMPSTSHPFLRHGKQKPKNQNQAEKAAMAHGHCPSRMEVDCMPQEHGFNDWKAKGPAIKAQTSPHRVHGTQRERRFEKDLRWEPPRYPPTS